MKLTVFLMRGTINSFEECLRETYVRGEHAIRQVSADPDLPYPCTGYLVVKERMRPKWLHFLETHFPLELSNALNGFLLLLRVEARIFAVSFGYAFHVLDSAKLEPDFGIKVCANSIDPSSIRTVDSRNIDIVTRQQRINLSSGSSIAEFGVELDQEWIRFLSGSPIDRQLANKLAGRDSLRINADIRLN